MSTTNFDKHLAKHLKDPNFAKEFERANDAWDIALQMSKLRQAAGFSQAALAQKLKTSQQQISRLESSGYQGHSLSMLRRVADVLNARVVVSFEPVDTLNQVNEDQAVYSPKSKTRKSAKKTSVKIAAKKSGTIKVTSRKVTRKRVSKLPTRAQ